MEIRTLRYFLAIAREENMSRAAENLHISQPALSRAMKSLEDELGTSLFVRHSFSIELTEEGHLLRKRAEDLVDMADKIYGEFSSMDDIRGGQLYFGLAESIQIRYLAREIHRFKQKYPDLQYHITSGGTEQVLERLNKGILDFGAVCEEPDYTKYDAIEFPEADQWGAIMPKDHPLAMKKAITVDDLIHVPLFCSEQSWKNDIPGWAGKRMRELHLEGTFQLAYNSAVFASENLGVLLTFDHLVDTSPESPLAFVPLEPVLETKLYLIWRKHQVFSPIASRFLKDVQKNFAE